MKDMTSKQKLIFLDIDGVLTSMDDTPGSYINHEPLQYGPSPTCVERIKKLCNETGAKIVISSNWRKHPDNGPCSFWTYRDGHQVVKTVQNPLPTVRRLLGNLVVGHLPPVRHTTKAEALILWFEENNMSEEDLSFVILDDDPRENFDKTFEYSIKDHFIMTSPEHGLTDGDV